MSPSVNVRQVCRAKNRLKAEVQSLKAGGKRNKKIKKSHRGVQLDALDKEGGETPQSGFRKAQQAPPLRSLETNRE